MNAAVGIAIGCLVVFAFTYLGGRGRDVTDGRHAPGAHGAHSDSVARGLFAAFGGGGASSGSADGIPGVPPGMASPPDAETGARNVVVAHDRQHPGGKDGSGGCKCSRHCLHVTCRKLVEAAPLTVAAVTASADHALNGTGHPKHTAALPTTTATTTTRSPAIKEGQRLQRELNLLSKTMEFGRCTPASCTKNKDGHCIAETMATEQARCSPLQRYTANRVRKCLIPTLRPPRSFTLERDTLSGMEVVCRGDVSTETCRGIDPVARANYDEVREFLENVMQHAPLGAAFIDFGDNDALLDLRIAALPNVTVHVFSSSPEQRNVAHLTACMAQLPETKMTIHRYNFTNTGVRNGKPIIPFLKGRPVVLRINAPGYEDVITNELFGTLDRLKPAVIIANGDAKLFGEWLMSTELPSPYMAWNPRVCRFANAVDALGKIGLAASRKMPAVWVKEETKQAITPHCKEACMVPSCQDGWRTEYRACNEASETCTADDLESQAEHKLQDGCYWRTSPGACKLDSNWQKVIRCADPGLPIATFSIVDVRGSLIACRGERDCVGVDTKYHDYTMNMLTQFFNQIHDTDKYVPEYVSVGAFVGNLGFSVAKHGIQAHLFEAVPSTRQWLKVSKCVMALGNAQVYDVGVGPADEECAIAPGASALEGNINVTCPAAPRSRIPANSEAAGDILVPFRTLDTILQHWKFEGASASRGAASPSDKAKLRGFVLHFDEAVDPLPLLQGGGRWLADEDWSPAAIIMAANAPDQDLVQSYVAAFGYSLAHMEGAAPVGTSGYTVFVANNKQR